MTNLPKKFIDSIQNNGIAIDLDGKNITNQDAEDLKQLITKMKDIVRAIDLSNNELGQDIIDVLKETIPKCEKVKYVFIRDTGLNEDNTKDIQQFFKTASIKF